MEIMIQKPPSLEDIAYLRERYQSEIQPFLNLKAKIYARLMPTYVVSNSPKWLILDYNIDEETKKTLELIDENIRAIHRMYFRDNHPT